MNKNVIGIIVVVVLLLLAGGGFLFMNKNVTNQPSSTISTTQSKIAANSNATAGIKSLKDLMALAGSLQCSFTDKETGSSGTIYSQSGKVRGDFQTQSNGKTSNSHMIQDSGFVYIWTEGQSKGYKASAGAVEKMSGSVTGDQAKLWDLQREVDYSCLPWGVDSAKFSVPADVVFTDYSKMIESAGALMQKNNGTSETSTTQIP